LAYLTLAGIELTQFMHQARISLDDRSVKILRSLSDDPGLFLSNQISYRLLVGQKSQCFETFLGKDPRPSFTREIPSCLS